MLRLTAIVAALLAGCASTPPPTPVAVAAPINVYEAAKDVYADAVVEAKAALAGGKLSLEGRAIITETLRRGLGHLEEMNYHLRMGTFAEAKAWAGCAIAASKLAREQVKQEAGNAGKRPAEYVEKL